MVAGIGRSRTSGSEGLESPPGPCSEGQVPAAAQRPRRHYGNKIEGRALRLARVLIGSSQRQLGLDLRCSGKAIGKYETGVLKMPPTTLQDAAEKAGLSRMMLTILADAAHRHVQLTDELRAELGAELLDAVLLGLRGEARA